MIPLKRSLFCIAKSQAKVPPYDIPIAKIGLSAISVSFSLISLINLRQSLTLSLCLSIYPLIPSLLPNPL